MSRIPSGRIATAATASPAVAARDDDEGLFSRDINGQLVRLDTPTEDDYGKSATLQIDAQSVTVPLAEPTKDAQGNIVLDISGRTTPRYTTIYDAAVRLYVKQAGDEKLIPIPILCHQPHMTPVAVCRLCVVQVYGQKRGKRAAERKLLPACQHQVKDGMEVFTMNDAGPDGQRVRDSVKVVTELLTADHLKPAPMPELDAFNELKGMADRCEVGSCSRFADEMLSKPATPAPLNPRAAGDHWPLDTSSPVFVVDHAACILCDRCARACDEVKQNNVIGRTGKGATAGIAFDIDRAMGDSSCVQCGECMVSCPTSAITYRPVAQVKLTVNGHAPAAAKREAPSAEVLRAEELIADPLFTGVPPKFLFWQEGLAVRRLVQPEEYLCRQGEPGNTAFLLKRGRLEVIVRPTDEHAKELRFEKSPADVILGEMACLSGTPRTADLRALEEGEVWEVRRNVLDRLMRSPTQRDRFESIYRDRALNEVLRGGDLFRGLPDEEYNRVVDFLRPRLSFVRVNPGQTIFKQGDWADFLYLVRLGHVRVVIQRPGRDDTMLYRGPGAALGEIGLLALSPDDVDRKPDDVDRDIADALAAGPVPAGRRSANVAALDHLELARVTRADFLEMARLFPALRKRLVKMSLDRLRGEEGGDNPLVRQYVEQGLYQGRSLLVLDLNKCTRCDECVRACIDQHGSASHGLPITRLIRDGERFGDYLVATACRSCKDAYCMIGCPVDAIHRGKHLQIVIEDHCIGCGLCATNCPYGNISMVPNLNHPGGQPKASTCDLCDAGGKRDEPLPRCVYACPHDAAHRMPGDQLLKRVIGTPRL